MVCIAVIARCAVLELVTYRLCGQDIVLAVSAACTAAIQLCVVVGVEHGDAAWHILQHCRERYHGVLCRAAMALCTSVLAVCGFERHWLVSCVLSLSVSNQRQPNWIFALM